MNPMPHTERDTHPIERRHLALAGGWLFAALAAGQAVLAAQAEPQRTETLGLIETTLVDSNASWYGTFQSHNQKVVATSDGIFMTYSRTRVASGSDEEESCLWRLVRSVDGGKTFQTAYESTNGTRAPVLEADKGGNLYMAHPDWNDKQLPFLFYRFARGGDYGRPLITTLTNVSCAAKYAMAYDVRRKQFYIATQYGHLLTVSPKGEELRRRAAFKTRGPHAATQYPSLAVSPDGVLHFAMTTAGPNKRGKVIYWDIHYMNSADGGLTWRKLDGTPLPADPVPDDTGPTDRISLDDEFQTSTWLANMLIKDGKVHFIYLGKAMHYLRYDLASGKKDVQLDGKELSGETISLSHGSGLLAARRDKPGSPLFLVTRNPARGTLSCLISRNNGQTWSDHAETDRQFNDNYAVGGAGQVTDDGHIIGSFTDRGHREIWFYRIKTD
jgi:hypothetical protein